MKIATICASILSLGLIAAMPVSEPLRDRIIADAQAMPPASLDFNRTTTMMKISPVGTTKVTTTENWNGKAWTLMSVNGKLPTAHEKHDAEKLATADPVPGYHSLAALLSASSYSAKDDQGRTVLRIPVLPPGSVRADGGDISSHLKAEVTLSARGGQPWAEQVRVTARETFKLNALITVNTFEQVSDYKLDANGKPRLTSQSADSLGSMFGFSGCEKRETTYAYH
jgi:hypothetical protein